MFINIVQVEWPVVVRPKLHVGDSVSKDHEIIFKLPSGVDSKEFQMRLENAGLETGHSYHALDGEGVGTEWYQRQCREADAWWHPFVHSMPKEQKYW
jgi:hypothetical protein